MAAHFSILAWRIPWTEEPGRLQPMRLQRVGHDLATKHQQQPHFLALGSRGSCLTTWSLILLICKVNIIKAAFKVFKGKARQGGTAGLWTQDSRLKSHGRNLRSTSWHEEFSTPRRPVPGSSTSFSSRQSASPSIWKRECGILQWSQDRGTGRREVLVVGQESEWSGRKESWQGGTWLHSGFRERDRGPFGDCTGQTRSWRKLRSDKPSGPICTRLPNCRKADFGLLR